MALTDLFILMCHILLWNLPYFLAQEDIPGSPCFSLSPALELSLLARILISFGGEEYLETKMWVLVVLNAVKVMSPARPAQ